MKWASNKKASNTFFVQEVMQTLISCSVQLRIKQAPFLSPTSAVESPSEEKGRGGMDLRSMRLTLLFQVQANWLGTAGMTTMTAPLYLLLSRGLNGSPDLPPPTPYPPLTCYFFCKVWQSVRSFTPSGHIGFIYQDIIMMTVFLNQNIFVLSYFLLARSLESIPPKLILAIYYWSFIIEKRMRADVILMCSLNIT